MVKNGLRGAVMSFLDQHFDTCGAALLNWLLHCLDGTVESQQEGFMKRLALLLVGLAAVGCARPGEFGYTPAYTANENAQQIARNWDIEGKEMVDDIDHALLLNPSSRLSEWNLR
jgi:hypothetical protein